MAAKFFKRSSWFRLVARISPPHCPLDGVVAAVWLMFAYRDLDNLVNTWSQGVVCLFK